MTAKELFDKLQSIWSCLVESKGYKIDKDTLINLVSELNTLIQKGTEDRETLRQCRFKAMSLRKVYRALQDPEVDIKIESID